MKQSYRLLAGLAGVVALLGVALWGIGRSNAAVESQIGYIDQDLIVEAYAGPQIDAVIRERDRLQALFDSESANLDAEEKQALFMKYEQQLQQFEAQVGIRRLMTEIDQALQASAEAHGVTVVLDINAVVLGGIDLTQDVQRRLGLIGE